MSASINDPGKAAPCNSPIASATASVPLRPDPIPCHLGKKRASAAESTGSTSLRRAASERRRNLRRTSASQNSTPDPPGRNSPVSRRCVPTSSASDMRAISWEIPKRAAICALVKGPCVRAKRSTKSRSGLSPLSNETESVKAVGKPTGIARPRPSRRRAASSAAL